MRILWALAYINLGVFDQMLAELGANVRKVWREKKFVSDELHFDTEVNAIISGMEHHQVPKRIALHVHGEKSLCCFL